MPGEAREVCQDTENLTTPWVSRLYTSKTHAMLGAPDRILLYTCNAVQEYVPVTMEGSWM